MISLSSRGALDGQVAAGLRRLLDRGAFLPGEALPAPAELAGPMVLNVHTVEGAYEALVRAGLLREEQGVYTVAEGRDDLDQGR